jgi:hypothetical protein
MLTASVNVLPNKRLQLPALPSNGLFSARQKVAVRQFYRRRWSLLYDGSWRF